MNSLLPISLSINLIMKTENTVSNSLVDPGCHTLLLFFIISIFIIILLLMLHSDYEMIMIQSQYYCNSDSFRFNLDL